jgi:ATP/maltotriose-dependent transcriptional regulator MalT
MAESPIPNLWTGLAQSARVLVRLAQGESAAAEQEARQTLTSMATSAPGRPLALALLCRALLAQGQERIAEACQVAGEGLAALEALGTALHDVRLLGAAAEAHHAAGGGLGAAEKARALAARACRRFEQIAARMDDPTQRERYLGQAAYVRACELSRASGWAVSHIS